MPSKTSKSSNEYVVVTIPGIEDCVQKDCKGTIILPGRIICKSIPKAPSKKIPCALTIYKLIYKCQFNSLDDLLKHISSIKWEIKNPFRVDCVRSGSHQFRSVDIEQAVSKLINKYGFIPDLKNPKTTIYIEIIDQTALVGILLFQDLNKRSYRVKYTNQSINASLAAALVKIADIKKTETILDPFCKDGVIPIEAYLQGAKKVIAIDSNQHWLRGAKINAKLAKAKIEFHNNDTGWLDTLFTTNSIDKIITTFFFSQKREDPTPLLREFFRSTSHIVKKNIAILTNNPEIVKKCAPQYKELASRKILRGDQHLEILQLKKKD